MISLAAREQIKLVVRVDELVVVGVLDPAKVSTVRGSCRRLRICGASKLPSMTMQSLTERVNEYHRYYVRRQHTDSEVRSDTKM
jgi:hypothetical protein